MSCIHRFILSLLAPLLLLLGIACGDAADTPPGRHPEGTDRAETMRPAEGHPHPAYARLQEAVAQYRGHTREGGWPTVAEGTVLEVGDSSGQVIPLRERLATTGDLSDAAAKEPDRIYDEQLSEAVRRFQQRHGLAEDGVVGPATVAALNVPAEERLAVLERNLERWESLPDTLGSRYVLVNIPEFRLRAYEGDRLAESMAVVVGAEYDGRETPVFRDTIDHIIFSPYWNVPPSIADEEIIPEAREDRDYLVENDYEIVSHYGPGAEVYDTYGTDLGRVVSGELRIRQKPGPNNALGLVKFMFPNDYAIYLHGTPEDHLFGRTTRAFSHGCIRVERPVDVAAFLLSRQQSSAWTRERIDEAMHDGEWQQVNLDVEVPVYILYWTAFVEEDGTVRFLEDVYGLDEGDPTFELS